MTSRVVYIGIRGPQPDHGHGGPSVVGVHRDGQRSNLDLRDVVSTLPGEFELTGEEVASWINDRLVMSSVAERGLPG